MATPGSMRALREANQDLLLRVVRSAGSLTQAELSRRTGLSRATVSNIVRDLSAAGLIRTSSTVSAGRRATAVSMRSDAGLAVGIDVGRSHVRVAIADLSHHVLGERSASVERAAPARDVVRTAAGLVGELLQEAGAETARVVAVGAGIPGPLDSRTGRVVEGTILPAWVGLPAADVLSDGVGLPVHVDNDANLGVLAEHTWGAARGVENVAYIKVSTGVGAGLVINGRLYRGQSGTAGEIGHTTIDENGPVCRCGNRGCLETMASVPVMCSLLEQSQGSRPTADEVIARADAGDPGCRRVLEDVGRYVGVAVANVCNLLNPGMVVIGGQLAAAGDLLLEPMRGVVRRHAVPAASSAVTVVASSLGERAEALGAVALALDAVPPIPVPNRYPSHARSLLDRSASEPLDCDPVSQHEVRG
ncbi:MAG: ROK family transcriptional regulator [Actinomycetes bacterium]